MKFVKGRLYRVVKNPYPECIGCVLRCLGFDSDGEYSGKQIKGGACTPNRSPCYTSFDTVPEVELVEHIDMVKFCKKLKKELDNESKNNV